MADISTPDFENDDLLRRQAQIAIQKSVPKPQIATPNEGEVTEPLHLPGVSPAKSSPASTGPQPAPRPSAFSEGERSLRAKHPFIGTLAEAGDVLGSMFLPGVTRRIPGTIGNERMRDELGLGRQKEQAGIAQEQATTAETNARVPQIEAQTREANANADQAGKPKPKEEEWSVIPSMVGPNGEPVQQEKNSGQIRFAPLSGVGPMKPAAEHQPNDFEQFYSDYIKENNLPDSAHNRLMARKEYAKAGQPPQRDPQQLAVGPDGTVIDLKPGMKVPAGTKTAAKYGEPTADEQRRADLAENLTENLAQLEGILQRKPELFGPLAGRLTSAKQWVGTSDPDIAALETIKHQLGMAQISAHGMRSAHGIAAAAESILNSFNNTPEAIRGAIQAARQSVGTFTADVAKAKGEQPQSTPGQQTHSSGIKITRDANGHIVSVE